MEAKQKHEIIRSKDCGNSPKQQFVEDLTIAVALGDAKFLLEHVTDDVVWLFAGSEPIIGKAAFAASLGEKRNEGKTKIIIKHVVSHGRKGAANGTIEFDNKQESIEFCCFHEFSNAKCTMVKEIKTYATSWVR